MTEYKTALLDIAAGDMVIEETHFGTLSLRKVDRLTKTQFCVADNRYSRETGKEIGMAKYCANFIYAPMARKSRGFMRHDNETWLDDYWFQVEAAEAKSDGKVQK